MKRIFTGELLTTRAVAGPVDSTTGNSEPSSPDRRQFLNWLFGTSFGATCIAIFYPIFRFLVPPEVVEATQSSVLAGAVNDLPPNSGKIFKFGNKPGLLIKTPTGELRAFAATCTHLDCTVQYKSDAKQIVCACHNGIYNLNGQNVSGPPPKPLEAYVVHTKGDEVYVSKT